MPKQYNIGDSVGPYHHVLLERIEKTPSNHWKCKFECGWCHNSTFITTIDHITRKEHNYVSCGCQDDRLLKEKKARARQLDKEKVIRGAKKARLRNSLYQVGTKWGHLTIVNITNMRDSAGNKIVECLCDCGKSNELYQYSTSYLYNIQNKRCCPLCKDKIISKGEKEISNLLDSKKIKYYQHFYFNDCVNPKTNYRLSFDFYLPDYNYCIEYDGRQHFESNNYFCHDSLLDRQYRDNLKNQYCQNKGIKLIRIPYTKLGKITLKDLEIE